MFYIYKPYINYQNNKKKQKKLAFSLFFFDFLGNLYVRSDVIYFEV